MNLFSLLESVLFLCFGISFIMVLLMFYHFKKRLDILEKKNETLGDICKTMVKQIENIKNEATLHNIPKDDSKDNLKDSDAELRYEPPTLDEFLKNLIDKTDPTTLGNIDPIYGIDPVLMYSQKINVNQFENSELNDVESVNDNDDLEEIQDTQVEELEELEDNIPAIKTSTQFDENNEPLDTIHVTKLEESEPLAEDDLSSQITENTVSKQKQTRKSLQKMNIQMLKTIVIRDGLSTDPTKMKKAELIQLILDNEEMIAKDLE